MRKPSLLEGCTDWHVATDLKHNSIFPTDKWAHQRKLEKYEDLREQCVRNGWITKVFSIEVGCRGFIADATFVFLTNLRLPHLTRENTWKRSKIRL